jgi:hypothetical protein
MVYICLQKCDVIVVESGDVLVLLLGVWILRRNPHILQAARGAGEGHDGGELKPVARS